MWLVEWYLTADFEVAHSMKGPQDFSPLLKGELFGDAINQLLIDALSVRFRLQWQLANVDDLDRVQDTLFHQFANRNVAPLAAAPSVLFVEMPAFD